MANISTEMLEQAIKEYYEQLNGNENENENEEEEEDWCCCDSHHDECYNCPGEDVSPAPTEAKRLYVIVAHGEIIGFSDEPARNDHMFSTIPVMAGMGSTLRDENGRLNGLLLMTSHTDGVYIE